MNWHLFFVIVSAASSLICAFFLWTAVTHRKHPNKDVRTGATIALFVCCPTLFLSLATLVCLLIP